MDCEISILDSFENTTMRYYNCTLFDPHIDGILLKGSYPPCLRMADRALLAGYPRYLVCDFYQNMTLYVELVLIRPLFSGSWIPLQCYWMSIIASQITYNLIVQQFLRLTSEGTSKLCITGPLWRESVNDQWIPSQRASAGLFPFHDVIMQMGNSPKVVHFFRLLF